MTDGEGNLIAIYGAIVATALAILQFYDRFLKRHDPVTTYSMSSNAENGNSIIIANPTPVPQMIVYWELYWGKRHFFKMIPTGMVALPDDGHVSATVEAYGWHTLRFRDGEHFDAFRRNGDRSNLYLVLHLAGRSRALTLRVYPDRPTLSDQLRVRLKRLKSKKEETPTASSKGPA